MSKKLTTTDDVIKALGGTKQACDMLCVKPQAISVWRVQNLFPPHTFPTISQELLSRGLVAEVSLWRWGRKSRVSDDCPAGGR